MTKETEIHQDEGVTLYEIGYLVVPTVAEEQLPGVVEEIHKTLETHQAEIKLEGAPAMRDLAYEIAKVTVGKRQKFNHAYFGFVVFTVTAEAAPKIKMALDANDKILRFILIKTDEETAMAPKIVPASLEAPEDTISPAVEVPKTTEEDIDKKIDTLVTS